MLLVAVAWFTLPAGSAAARNAALVLVADKYTHLNATGIPTSSGDELSAALTRHGFEVTVITEPNNASARAALREFSNTASAADFALIISAGHFATFRQQSYFLPTNTNVRRGTDLYSRGIAVPTLTDIAKRAKQGAVLLLPTVPDIPSTVGGVTTRASLGGTPLPDVVVTLPVSAKVPNSGVNLVVREAMRDLLAAAKAERLSLAALVDGATAGNRGVVSGTVADITFSPGAKPAAAMAPASRAQPPADDAAEKARAADREAARKANEQVAEKLRQAQERARIAEQRARQAEEKARQDRLARTAALEAQRQAELQARERAERDAAEQARAEAQAQAQQQQNGNQEQDVASLQVMEAMLGRAQRMVIQRRLRKLNLYTGKIDAIFGDDTRAAIKQFQGQENATETGYLTPQQLQRLMTVR